MATIHSINLIASDPDVRGGRPCIAGTGIRVLDVVTVMLFHDQTPAEIAEAYALTLAQVHAALAYYYEHKAEIDADIREQIAKAEEFKEKRVGSRGAAPAPHAL
ncbi:MAG: DUF433 domain-containing protein [Chloroflexota bacterium]|jgi:uncharacterized protein (DUF433 family)